MTASDYFAARDYSSSSLIVVPGTSDADGATLSSWANFIVDRFPAERTQLVDYPATVGPLIGGWNAHRYDESKAIARWRTRHMLGATTGRVVLLGYSQGADALWQGVTDAVEAGEKDPADIEAILWAHPQHPEGLKDVMQRKHKVTSAIFKHAFHATMDGAWIPHSDIETTSIAIEGDPITRFPRTRNPVRLASRFHAGFYMIHSGLGDEGAAQLKDLQVASVSPVAGTKTTYLELAANDPVEQRARRKQMRRY